MSREAERDLVVVMAGDASLHEAIADGRDFDLWVIYYGSDEQIARRYAAGCDRFWARKGLKLELVRTVLLEELHLKERFGFAERYRYVFLPDDDIDFGGGAAAVRRLFDHAAAVQADVFQPAISNQHASFQATRQIEGAFCHQVSWVENMMPGFRAELFVSAFLAGVHALDYLRSGWGLEPIVMKLGEAQLGRGLRTFVIDASPVVHTRPVGRNSVVHEIGWDERLLNPQIDSSPMRTLGVFATAEGATRLEPSPVPRNPTAIALAMQRVRLMRKLWKNLFD